MKIKLFQSLTLKQAWWVNVAYWRLWWVWLRIKLKQGSWLKQKVFRQTPTETKDSASPSLYSLAMHESVRLASRLHFLPMTCLPKSIVLADMLCARGENASVRIGVGKSNAQLASHAWVEINGVMVGEPESVNTSFVQVDW